MYLYIYLIQRKALADLRLQQARSADEAPAGYICYTSTNTYIYIYTILNITFTNYTSTNYTSTR